MVWNVGNMYYYINSFKLFPLGNYLVHFHGICCLVSTRLSEFNFGPHPYSATDTSREAQIELLKNFLKKINL
jgi:hypothetical protein